MTPFALRMGMEQVGKQHREFGEICRVWSSNLRSWHSEIAGGLPCLGIGQAGRKVPEYFWGENLEAARHSQITLAVPDKLVYSPHIYVRFKPSRSLIELDANMDVHVLGPWHTRCGSPWRCSDVQGPGLVEYMHYFMDEHFADDMPHVWNTHFGFLFGGKAGVVIGEWGGPLKTEADRQWQRAVVDYLIRHDHVSSFYCDNSVNVVREQRSLRLEKRLKNELSRTGLVLETIAALIVQVLKP
eukprot:4502366-Pleurochrysis_carterae.AAC.3